MRDGEFNTIDRERLMSWFNFDEEAVAFFECAWAAAHGWDDITDENKVGEHTNAMISWFAFGKEMMPFFERNAPYLRPVMLSVYLQWQAANALEAHTEDGDTRLEKSLMLRAGIYNLAHFMAYLCGGHDHAVEVALEIFDSYGETVEGLKREFL